MSSNAAHASIAALVSYHFEKSMFLPLHAHLIYCAPQHSEAKFFQVIIDLFFVIPNNLEGGRFRQNFMLPSNHTLDVGLKNLYITPVLLHHCYTSRPSFFVVQVNWQIIRLRPLNLEG
mmetsp:Transcript_28283/g.55062  ORF Transcript_28283/g.55062 Transcript_28283/m.55062 type:complete len:118 (-) Transcript_28283:64-417(-)